MKLIFTSFLLLIIFNISAQVDIINEYICPPCNNSCDLDSYNRPGVCSHCNMVLVRKDQSKTIAFYLQNGVEVLDFAGPMEVFAYAGYKVFTVSKTKEPIKSQGILTVIPDYSIEDAPSADILAFFGGNSTEASKDGEVIQWIQAQENIQYHFSVCTGAFVLAESGLLDGKTATTFHSALDGLEKFQSIDVRRDVRFVDNGKVITTAGISAGIDGALHLVAKLQGLNAAKRTAYYMEYDNWVPGDGLILSLDNPYIAKRKDLLDYQGRYQYKDDTEMVLSIRDGDLKANLNGIFYPLFHESEDIFSDVGSEPVYFIRNKNNKILGYKLEPDGNLFKRLD